MLDCPAVSRLALRIIFALLLFGALLIFFAKPPRPPVPVTEPKTPEVAPGT